MNIINIISVLGLLMASCLGYQRVYMGMPGPSHYPFFVTYIMIISYAVSYVLSLWNVASGMAKLLGLLSAAMILLVAIIFSVSVLLGKASYPHMFGFPACYIHTVLSIFLVFLWNKKK